jgi:hypothetical protein
MIVKSKHVRASRVNQRQASSALKSHFKYLQYRERDVSRESKADRHLFDKEHDQVDRRDAHDAVMEERVGDIYYHRIILSPSQQEPVEDWHAWTRAVMSDLEDQRGLDLHWYAVHHHNTDDPHVHVVLAGTGIDRETGQARSVELSPQDFRQMREAGREHSQYEHYHLIQETLRDLDERDTTTREAPAPARDATHEIER